MNSRVREVLLVLSRGGMVFRIWVLDGIDLREIQTAIMQTPTEEWPSTTRDIAEWISDLPGVAAVEVRELGPGERVPSRQVSYLVYNDWP